MMSSAEGLMAGVGAGCCICKKATIDFTSASYELSAKDLPLAANRHAAIHLAYCSSYEKIQFSLAKMYGFHFSDESDVTEHVNMPLYQSLQHFN